MKNVNRGHALEQSVAPSGKVESGDLEQLGDVRTEDEHRPKSLKEKQRDFLSLHDGIDEASKIFERHKGLISIFESQNKKFSLSQDHAEGEIYNDRGKMLKQLINLEDRKRQWVEENGRENVPEGILYRSDNDWYEVKSSDSEQLELQKNSPEERRNAIEKEIDKALHSFEKSFRNHWKARSAQNLELCIAIVEKRLPKMLRKATTRYVKGEEDSPPFGYIILRGEMTSPLKDILTGENRITRLEIVLDNKPIEIAGKGELTVENWNEQFGSKEIDDSRRHEDHVNDESEKDTAVAS